MRQETLRERERECVCVKECEIISFDLSVFAFSLRLRRYIWSLGHWSSITASSNYFLSKNNPNFSRKYIFLSPVRSNPVCVSYLEGTFSRNGPPHLWASVRYWFRPYCVRYLAEKWTWRCTIEPLHWPTLKAIIVTLSGWKRCIWKFTDVKQLCKVTVRCLLLF